MHIGCAGLLRIVPLEQAALLVHYFGGLPLPFSITEQQNLLLQWLQQLSGVTSWAILVQRGLLARSFEVKLYRFRDYSIGHNLYSSLTSDDNDFNLSEELCSYLYGVLINTVFVFRKVKL